MEERNLISHTPPAQDRVGDIMIKWHWLLYLVWDLLVDINGFSTRWGNLFIDINGFFAWLTRVGHNRRKTLHSWLDGASKNLRKFPTFTNSKISPPSVFAFLVHRQNFLPSSSVRHLPCTAIKISLICLTLFKGHGIFFFLYLFTSIFLQPRDDSYVLKLFILCPNWTMTHKILGFISLV